MAPKTHFDYYRNPSAHSSRSTRPSRPLPSSPARPSPPAFDRYPAEERREFQPWPQQLPLWPTTSRPRPVPGAWPFQPSRPAPSSPARPFPGAFESYSYGEEDENHPTLPVQPSRRTPGPSFAAPFGDIFYDQDHSGFSSEEEEQEEEELTPYQRYCRMFGIPEPQLETFEITLYRIDRTEPEESKKEPSTALERIFKDLGLHSRRQTSPLNGLIEEDDDDDEPESLPDLEEPAWFRDIPSAATGARSQAQPTEDTSSLFTASATTAESSSRAVRDPSNSSSGRQMDIIRYMEEQTRRYEANARAFGRNGLSEFFTV